jgi:hypothetical protein
MTKTKAKAPVTRASDKFILRLPDGMRAKINAVATANGRSMNSEIVSRLESSFTEQSRVEAALADLRANMDKIAIDVAMMAAREGAQASEDYRKRVEAERAKRRSSPRILEKDSARLRRVRRR